MWRHWQRDKTGMPYPLPVRLRFLWSRVPDLDTKAPFQNNPAQLMLVCCPCYILTIHSRSLSQAVGSGWALVWAIAQLHGLRTKRGPRLWMPGRFGSDGRFSSSPRCYTIQFSFNFDFHGHLPGSTHFITLRRKRLVCDVSQYIYAPRSLWFKSVVWPGPRWQASLQTGSL